MLDAKTQQFIEQYANTNIHELLLKKNQFKDIDIAFAIQQIVGQRKAKHKLPTWYQTQSIVYPSSISMQQCSSEQTAAYKAGLVKFCRLTLKNSS